MKYLILCVVLLFKPVQNPEWHYSIENSKLQRTSVGKINKDKHKEFECLVKLLYHEARGEGEKGILYVLSVVENRKNSNKYPNSYCKITYQHKQFSFVTEGKTEVKPTESEREVLDFIKVVAYNAVQGAFRSLLPSNVLHYSTTKVNNYWTKKKKVYTVQGNHRFYLSQR